jgi:pectin methylesterase-like acyl-CoA thioesterase
MKTTTAKSTMVDENFSMCVSANNQRSTIYWTQKWIYLFVLSLFFTQSIWADEKLLYSTDFQDWTAISTYTSESTVTKTTDFSAESLVFKLYYVTVDPTKYDATRFAYTPADVTTDKTLGIAGPVSKGAIIAQKSVDCYVQTSPLNSITRIEFVEGATGSSRGYKVWKKNATDADWVSIYSTYATTASGQTVSLTLNETNVALKFTNLAIAQNAYMFSLKIYGNYVSSNPQYALTTSLNIPAAGAITRTPNSDNYDQGSVVSLQATPNFGYKFVKWTDGSDNDLSTANPYSVTMDAAKTIKAVFAAVNTYSFNVAIAGSTWGQVKLTPLPTNGMYEEGTLVTVDVVSNPVTNFLYWEDNSTAAERVITVVGNKSLTATFDEKSFIVGWDFKNQTPTQSRPGDFYSETTNTGVISLYESAGTAVGWLANTGSFSPSYPCIRFWTLGTDFLTKHRYLQASFSTVGYKNIKVNSLVGANYQAYSINTLQYSLDGTTFTELARADITMAYNAGWVDLSASLPAATEGQTKIYLRWAGDTSSPVLGQLTTNNDGTAVTNIYAFADKVITEDHDAPLLVSSIPVDKSATASITGSVVLTFNEKVKAGTGNITLGSSAVTGSYGSKTVTFPYERLSYNSTYTFTVPAGALTDLSGNAYAGLTFSFTTEARTEPVKKLFDAVVAPDGTGDYTTVLAAIAGAPSNSTTPWVIYVRNGKYTGHHDIPATKPFLHLIGQSRDNVIISDNRLSGDAGDGTPVYNVAQGATMVVNSANCYFEDITFENSWGYEKQAGPQALAMYTPNDHITFNNCYMRSYQDTYLSSYNNVTDRHYLKNCKIEGAVDFIYGGGDVFFDKCTITCVRKDGGYIVAPSHKSGTLWGYVFSNCTINSPTTVTGLTTYFGRPWQNAPKTVFLNTKLNVNIYPAGWYYKMGAIPAVFADYGSMDANGNAVDLSQRITDYQYDTKDANGNVTGTVTGTAKNSLTDAEAATYTYENVILRSGDTWNPRLIAEAPDKPSNVAVSGAVVTWNNVAYTRLYIVFRNNDVLGFTTDTHFTDTKVVAGTTYTYAVQAVSEYGALSETTTATSGVSKTDQVVTISQVSPKTYGNTAFTLSSTVTPSGYDVVYSVSSGPAIISGNTVTLNGAGDVVIVAAQNGDSNYNPASSSITIPVAKATLSVAVVDTFRKQSAANPVYRLTYTGFINNDHLTDIDQLPVGSCAADASTAPGVYSITAGGGSDNNYDFTYIPGILTVTSNVSVKVSFAGSLEIYPNPSKGIFYMNNTGLQSNSFVEIYNQTGRMLCKISIQENPEKIDLSGLTNGVYILKFITGQQTEKRMLIKY